MVPTGLGWKRLAGAWCLLRVINSIIVKRHGYWGTTWPGGGGSGARELWEGPGLGGFRLGGRGSGARPGWRAVRGGGSRTGDGPEHVGRPVNEPGPHQPAAGWGGVLQVGRCSRPCISIVGAQGGCRGRRAAKGAQTGPGDCTPAARAEAVK